MVSKKTIIIRSAILGLALFLMAADTPCIPDNNVCGPVFPPLLDDSFSDTTFVALEPNVTSMQPGQSSQFSIMRWECCWIPVPATSTPCVQWSIEPETAGTIDNNGNFTLAADASSGQQVTIRASFPPPNELNLTAKVGVYSAETNPLVRTWSEVSAIDCNSKQEIVSDELFQELIFRATGDFLITWFPFEVYHDYWGTYTYDSQTRQLSMTINGGNYIPPSVDLEGTVQIRDDGTVLLDSIYFGAPPGSQNTTATCGHIIQ